MKKLALAAALAVFATGASAQSDLTYEEMFEQGTLGNVSQWEKHIGRLLQEAGVSDECIGRMSVTDINMIDSVLRNDSMSGDQQKRRIRAFLNDFCAPS